MKSLPCIYFRLILVALIIAVSIPAAASQAGSADSASVRKVIMVVMPGVSLDDLLQTGLPNVRKLSEIGALGLMNSRTAGRLQPDEGSFLDPRYTPESGYVTIGAGARAIAGSDARKAFNQWEIVENGRAYEVFRRRTLVEPGSAEVVHPGIARLLHQNSDFNHEVRIGLLGTELHAGGFKTAAVGNSDGESVHREVAAICMDGNGLVDFGNVSRGMVEQSPGLMRLYRTNTRRLVEEAARCIDHADFIVIELGDLARLDRARLDLMEGVFELERLETLKRADDIIGELLSIIDLDITRLVLLSPYPSSYIMELSGNSLCPALVAGGGFRPGLLTSGSTRVTGVVANTDIAPSILEWLGAPPSTALLGRSITCSESRSPTRELQELNARISLQAAGQPVLRQVAAVIIVLVGIITVLWLIIPKDSRPRRVLFPFLILLPPVQALTMFLLALFPTDNHLVLWLRLVVLSFGLAALSLLVARRGARALMLISLAFIVMVFADLVTGGRMCRFSIMGYSIVDGSRYYGIGNEFMGALIGSSTVGIGLLLRMLHASRRASKAVLFCSLVLLAVLVGAPELGANVGGAIATVVAFGVMLASTSKSRLDFRRVAGIALAVVLVLAVFAALDSLRGQQHESHLGRAINLLRADGLSQFGMLVKRKLAMNLLLIRISVWSRLLLAYAISTVIVLRGATAREKLMPLPLHLRVSLAGTAGGTLAALAFNDSGVVAAGTCFVYAWALTLLASLHAEGKADIPSQGRN